MRVFAGDQLLTSASLPAAFVAIASLVLTAYKLLSLYLLFHTYFPGTANRTLLEYMFINVYIQLNHLVSTDLSLKFNQLISLESQLS